MKDMSLDVSLILVLSAINIILLVYISDRDQNTLHEYERALETGGPITYEGALYVCQQSKDNRNVQTTD